MALHYDSRTEFIVEAIVALTLFIAFVKSARSLSTRMRWRSNYPPGPPSLPLIGAALQMPRQHEWLAYYQWQLEYGPIVGVRAMGQHILLLNTSELAHELLDNRSNIYSNRPAFPMLEMMGFPSWNVGIMGRGQRHRMARRLMMQGFSAKALPGYKEIQQNVIHHLLWRMLIAPASFHQHLRNNMVSLIIRIVYGINTEHVQNDDFVRLNEESIATASLAGSPGAFLVNTFPILKYWPEWLPGSSFKKVVHEGRTTSEYLMNLPLGLLEDEKAQTEVSQTFLTPHLQLLDNSEQKYAALAVAATSYGAGVETSTSLLLSFVLAMMLHPEIQTAAQDEIDRVILNRLPILEDRAQHRLPWIDAILTECYRWAPPGPFGLPHCLSQDDTFRGYVLPKGTIVMANIWGITHDSTIYPDPMVFSPARFMGAEPQRDPRETVFGYGRRSCPGRYLAEGMLWQSFASLLTCFRFLPETDPSGRPVQPSMNYTSGVMSRPEDFLCRIVPRSPAAVQLIEELNAERTD